MDDDDDDDDELELPHHARRGHTISPCRVRIDSDGDIRFDSDHDDQVIYIAKPHIQQFMEWLRRNCQEDPE